MKTAGEMEERREEGREGERHGEVVGGVRQVTRVSRFAQSIEGAYRSL